MRVGELWLRVVCDTAKVRFFKQITTRRNEFPNNARLFAILQKCDFSSKSQLEHDTFDRLTTLFAILQKYDFSSKPQLGMLLILIEVVLTFNVSINWVEFIFFVW